MDLIFLPEDQLLSGRALVHPSILEKNPNVTHVEISGERRGFFILCPDSTLTPNQVAVSTVYRSVFEPPKERRLLRPDETVTIKKIKVDLIPVDPSGYGEIKYLDVVLKESDAKEVDEKELHSLILSQCQSLLFGWNHPFTLIDKERKIVFSIDTYPSSCSGVRIGPNTRIRQLSLTPASKIKLNPWLDSPYRQEQAQIQAIKERLAECQKQLKALEQTSIFVSN